MDPRVARTRTSLQDALLGLARERPLDEITVADVTARAGVNRSSFYQHYSDKETLLADALEAAVDEVSASLDLPTPFAGPHDGMPEELLIYLAHIAENATVYRRVLGDHGSAVVAARLRVHLERIVRDAVAAAEPEAFADLPLDVVAAGIAGTALGVVTAWLSRNPLPPIETAADWVWRVLIGPAERSLRE